uniref:Ig-like domain-containing protein n=1 Tax=Bos mutus grunniens TaxID=30521 RepID=A0A8B9Y682_BOSMU
MRGSATTLTFTALLCLGELPRREGWKPLSSHIWSLTVLPKPSIRVDPGTMVAQGSPVTIWCQGSLLAEVYRLHKERSSVYWEAKAPQGSRNKAWFHFASSSSSDAGQYWCAYHSRNGWSQRSDTLPLVVTGVYRAPSLSAQPSPVVAAGGRVSLTCSSQYAAGSLHLLKEGGTDPLRHKASKNYGNQGQEQAVFPVGPVTTSHGGTYRCYDAPSTQPYLWSRPSGPLHLQVTGEAPRAPSLSAQPSSLVLAGDNLTLQCRSEAGFGSFALTKDEGLSLPLRLEGQQSPDFPLGRVSRAHGGQYRCYSGQNSYAWSAPSAPLDILIAGEAPLSWSMSRLSAQGAGRGSALNVTLQCRSEAGFGSFALTKDEGLSLPLRLEGQQSPDFPLGRVSRAHGGQYRCYSGHNSYAWSAPSAPLDILIAGEEPLKPSLSARPGASVPQGENVTLQCRSEVRSDTFHLSKEGSLAAPQHLRLQDPAPPVQANFTLRAVTSAHSGTYRCYSSHSTAPHLLSLPSDPLELQVSGEGPTWASGRPEPAPLPLPDTHSTSTQAPCWGRADGEAGLCRVGDGSGWAGRELGLMHPSLNWCSAWK